MRDLFKDAFDQFKTSGRFELKNTSLSLQNLNCLCEYLDSGEGHLLELYLHHVTVIDKSPDEVESIHAKEEARRAEVAAWEAWRLAQEREHLPKGAITEEELTPLLRNHPRVGMWESPYFDPNVHGDLLSYPPNSLTHPQENAESSAILPLHRIVQAFQAVIQAGRWVRIELDEVYFRDSKEQLSPVRSALFAQAVGKGTSIKRLSLKAVQLDELSFLSQMTVLERVSLEAADHSDGFIPALCGVLARHPSLKRVDLNATQLSQASYEALDACLYQNYRMESLQIASSNKPSLQKTHEHLMARLQKKPVERFQEEQITVERLYTLAENSLLGEEKNQPPLFRFLSDGGTLAISLQKPSSKTLNLPANSPAIFHAYPEHLYAGQPFFLDLRQAMGSHTIGYRLLEKSFAAKNHQAMEMLLENGADILEAPSKDQRSLLNQVFDAPDTRWRDLLVSHFEKDLEQLIPQWERLTPYHDIHQGFTHIKVHLNHFLRRLLEQMQLPTLLKLFAFGIETKKRIYQKDLQLLVGAGKEATAEDPVNYGSLMGLSAYLTVFLEEAKQAKKSWFSGYRFHQVLIEQLESLIKTVEERKGALEQIGETEGESALQKENTALKTEISRLKEQIEKQEKETQAKLAEQKKAMQAKLAKQEKAAHETQAKLAEQEKVAHETQAKLAEQEKIVHETQTKLAEQEKATQETKAQLAEQQTKMDELWPLLQLLKEKASIEASESQEPKGATARFFTLG